MGDEKKVIVAMSGGVDSSVTAAILKEKGYNICGATMKLFDNEDIGQPSKTCCSLNDVEDARFVANKLGIDHFVYNFKDKFRSTVIDRFIKTYENGETPNPCIDCNRYIKFMALLERAKELSWDYVATGHYARVQWSEEKKRYLLKKAIDDTKDQSYVLYTLTQEQLSHIMFPLGGLNKTQVREIAQEYGFSNANKPDSQDICFVPDGNYVKFMETYANKTFPKGNFLDTNGNVLGQHQGIVHYTVGQRKGLGMAFQKPMYVVAKNKDTNEVILGEEKDLLQNSLLAYDINLISVDKIDGEMEVTVKTRYNQKPAKAKIKQKEKDLIEVDFYEPQRAITKGQAVVFYDNDIVVGGGTIK